MMKPAAARVEAAAASEGDFLRAAVRLMLASLTVMVLALFSLYFAPIPLAPALSAGLYAGLACLERRHGVSSPVTVVMLGFYLLLCGLRLAGGEIAWSAYTGPLVYLVLAGLILGLWVAGRPFTATYSRGAGYAPVHTALSLGWGGLHLAAAAASWFLMPSLAFLFVPLGLMLAGALMTLIVNFVTMGPHHGRQRRFVIGRFTFAQVEGEAERDQFYDVVAEAYRGDLMRAAGPARRIDKAMIEAEHRASDAHRGMQASVPFIVLDGDTPVGGICLFLDHPELGLPIEAEAGLTLARQRHGGPVVEMGRLGILPRYRLERQVLTGLFRAVIETAMERRVHWIMNDSFSFQVPLYRKIGFVPMQDSPYQGKDGSSTGYGLQCLPMSLDLVEMVSLDRRTTTSSEVQSVLQPYVVERFFKIITLRRLFADIRGRRAGAHTAEEVFHAAE